MLATTLLQVDSHHRFGHRCLRVAVRGLLQAGERRLPGEIPAAVGRAPARPLPWRVGAEGIDVIPVSIAAAIWKTRWRTRVARPRTTGPRKLRESDATAWDDPSA
jgi:hypothetical protein